MSTKNPGKACAECLHEQRCAPTCTTQGNGYYIASGFTHDDGRIITAPCIVQPNGNKGVALVSCSQRITMVHNLSKEATRTLIQHLTSMLEDS